MLVDPSLGLSKSHAIGLFPALANFNWFTRDGIEQFLFINS